MVGGLAPGGRRGTATPRKARPARIRLTLIDDPTGTTPLPLPTRRSGAGGAVFALLFVVFGAIAVAQIRSMFRGSVTTVFDLTSLLFRIFWTLGWSVGVLILFLLAVLFLFYRETARLGPTRLVFESRLGPLRFISEYDLARIRDLRADPAGAGLARIRFTYDGGQASLGNAMTQSAAESRVRTIADAMREIAAVPPEPGPDQAAAPPEPEAASPPARETAPVRWQSPSGLALLAANMVPLAGVLLFGWDLGQVMVLFWAESAVVGFYTLLKLVVVGRWMTLVVGPFFLGHFGGFMAGHFLFVYYLFVRGGASGPEPGPLAALTELFAPLWPALLTLAVSHGLSFWTNYLGRKEYRGHDLKQVMAAPYKRIIVLHVTIIVGGWLVLLLGSPLPALVLLVALKAAVDLRAHRREHAVRSGAEGS